MKKVFLLLSIISVFGTLILTSCKKDEPDPPPPPITVPMTQKVLFNDMTATWCGPCGESGTPLFKECCTERADKVIAFALHVNNSELIAYITKNDTLRVPLVQQMLPQMDYPNAVPTFNLNQSQVTRVKTFILDGIDAIASQTPKAQVNFVTTRTANGVQIRSNTKFFTSMTGEFYLQFYIIEDNVLNRQNTSSGYNDLYIHDHILRSAVYEKADSLKAFGSLLISGDIPKDKEIEKSFTFTYDANTTFKVPSKYAVSPWVWNPSKQKVAGIIWQKNGSKYSFINGEIKSM